MQLGLRDSLTEAELRRLQIAMDWVIPADSSAGAGTDVGVSRLLDLIDSQGPAIAASYQSNLPGLRVEDLADPANEFAALFIEHVRDGYYGSPETGSWADIGFEVTDK